MIATLTEAQCLAGYCSLTGGAYTGLVATKGDGSKKPSLYVVREVLVAGFCTSWVTSVLNFTDAAKVRVQAGAHSGSAMYRGFVPTMQKIVAEEGLAGLLLPGIVASCLRDLTYTGLSIGLYPSFKAALFGHEEGGDIGFVKKAVCATASGMVFSGFVNPTDFVKIVAAAEAGKVGPDGRLETGLCKGRVPTHANSVHLFPVALRLYGLKGLFRGTSATVARAALARGAQLSTYDHSKTMMKRHLGMQEGPVMHGLGSVLSGVAAATACMPADIVKTRVMADTAGKYRGFLDCFLDIVRNNGVAGLWRGWTPTVARLAPHFTLAGVLMEQMRRTAGLGFYAT